MKYKLLSVILLATMFGLLACVDDDDDDDDNITGEPTPYTIEVPNGWPTILNIPEDNPMTVEGIELGRYLFYDGRLSGRDHADSLMSCATCHLQE